MKIEGLGQKDAFMTVDYDDAGVSLSGSRNLYESDLKPGRTVFRDDDGGMGGDDWIITDVLGDGKFKAMPKSLLDEYNGDIKALMKNEQVLLKKPFTFQAK